jgi:glutaredoxin
MHSFWKALAVLAGLALLGGAGLVALGRGPDALGALAGGASSRVRVQYQFVDDAGRVCIVDSLDEVPPEKRAGVGRIEHAPRAAARAPDARRGAPAPAAPKLVIFTTASCGYSRKLLHDLDALGVDYENRDVDRDSGARDELVRLTGSAGVPVSVVGDEVLEGWGPGRAAEIQAKLGAGR